MRPLVEIEADLRAVEDEITDLYWTYTRTARGKPPCVARPGVYERRNRLRDELRHARKRTS